MIVMSVKDSITRWCVNTAVNLYVKNKLGVDAKIDIQSLEVTKEEGQYRADLTATATFDDSYVIDTVKSKVMGA